MITYAMLLNPSHNRIYFDSAKTLAGAELSALLSRWGDVMRDIRIQSIAGIDYLLFDCEEELSAEQTQLVGRSSCFFALFKLADGGMLQPVEVITKRIFDDSINTILKYQGKTNELFTRMMVNLAVSACTPRTDGKALVLLDPLCGKGTTLFEGAIWGYDTIGIDTNAVQIQEIKTYFSAYLKRLHVHHEMSKDSRRVENKKAFEIVHFDYSNDKAALKGGNGSRMTLAAGDSASSSMFIKNNLCDMLVADLPYGVQHAAKSVAAGQNKVTALSRNACTLVERALPAWKKALRKGASVVLSFNELTTKKAELAEILTSGGFTVLEGEYFHRVDQAINRDLIVAVLYN